MTLPNTLSIVYTAPARADIGQDRASVPLDGTPLPLTAVCGSRLVAYHPSGLTLQLARPMPVTDMTPEYLAVVLPEIETELDLVLVTGAPAATARIKVTTKKEFSKPGEPRVGSFGG